MWTSTDGVAWTRVSPPADFASASVYTVDGGHPGFIATGTLKDGLTQAIWTSSDGRSWLSKILPKSAFGEVIVQGATAFAGGYVASGAIRGDDGCGGPRYLTPSLWWSADGTAWSRAPLAGAAPATAASMTVTKVSDNALMAVANEWDAATQVSSTKVWVTGDGRAWRQVASPSSLLGDVIQTDGQHGLAISDAGADPLQTSTPLTVATVADDLSVRVLVEVGDVPTVAQQVSAWSGTLGPAGLVVLSGDGSKLWLGVPAAG